MSDHASGHPPPKKVHWMDEPLKLLMRLKSAASLDRALNRFHRSRGSGDGRRLVGLMLQGVRSRRPGSSRRHTVLCRPGVHIVAALRLEVSDVGRVPKLIETLGTPTDHARTLKKFDRAKRVAGNTSVAVSAPGLVLHSQTANYLILSLPIGTQGLCGTDARHYTTWKEQTESK